MENTPEKSAHTSIKKRAVAVKKQRRQPKTLMPFVGNTRQNMPKGMPLCSKTIVSWSRLQGVVFEKINSGISNIIKALFLKRLG
jgi:hypothetical protein